MASERKKKRRIGKSDEPNLRPWQEGWHTWISPAMAAAAGAGGRGRRGVENWAGPLGPNKTFEMGQRPIYIYPHPSRARPMAHPVFQVGLSELTPTKILYTVSINTPRNL